VAYHLKPAVSEQLEHSNPPGQHVPSLKLNQQLINISQRQTGQVGRVNLLFMSFWEEKAVGREIQGQPGHGHLPVKILWSRLLHSWWTSLFCGHPNSIHTRRRRRLTSPCLGDIQPYSPTDFPLCTSSRDEKGWTPRRSTMGWDDPRAGVQQQTFCQSRKKPNQNPHLLDQVEPEICLNFHGHRFWSCSQGWACWGNAVTDAGQYLAHSTVPTSTSSSRLLWPLFWKTNP